MKNGLYLKSSNANRPTDYVLIQGKQAIIFPTNSDNGNSWSDYVEVSNTSSELTNLTEINIDDDKLAELSERVNLLSHANAKALFDMTAIEVRLVKNTIDKINASHVRFFSDEEDIILSIFNIQEFGVAHRFTRKVSQRIRYFNTTGMIYEPFSFTIFASTFKKLTLGKLDFRIGDNDKIIIANENGSTLYVQNQKLIEPVNLFYSPKIDSHISFVFHPKS